jgi:hypothetical protein
MFGETIMPRASLTVWTWRTAVLVAALLSSAVPVRAQVRAMPGSNAGQPVAQTGGTVQSAPPAGAMAPNPAAYAGGVAPYPSGGYATPYPPMYGPYGGTGGLGNTLQGAASVVNAQGQLGIQNQQAKLLQQDVERSKQDTRRKQFDEYQYEKANTPTPEDIRQAQMAEDLRRMRNDPPPADIWSGLALNTLLKTIGKGEAMMGYKGPAIPLDPSLTKQLNLSTGVSGAGLGALKGQNLDWPLSLQKPMFEAERKKIEGLSGQLVVQATAGKVDPPTLQNMRDSVTALKGKVKDKIDDMTPSENIKANRYCNELLDAARSLEDPAAVNRFNGQWSVTARTVPELVDEMGKKGLSFAPAVAGQEAAYTATYRALVDYDVGLGQMSARLQSPGPAPR